MPPRRARGVFAAVNKDLSILYQLLPSALCPDQGPVACGFTRCRARATEFRSPMRSLSPPRRAANLCACSLLGCFSTARAVSQSPALRAAALLGCAYRAHATPGVALEIVDSALVFDGGAAASGLSDNNDAVQCLRAAIAAVLTTGTGSVAGDATPWVSTVAATSYTDSRGEQDSKITFSISMTGIDAQTVLDDLITAVVTTTTLTTELNSCGWPYNALDAEETEHVLQEETFQRASFAEAGAVISSALVLDGLPASLFNADVTSKTRFKDVAASILSASTSQIDNVVADDYYGNHFDPAVHTNVAPSGSVIHFDVAIHFWPHDSVILVQPEPLAQVLLAAVVDGRAQAALTLYAATCDCALAGGSLNVIGSQDKITELTLDGTHSVTSPPVPCTNCGGDDEDDDDLGVGARIAIALAAVFCFLGGVFATVLYISRRNKFNGCMSPAKRRISGFTGSADLELRPVDPTQKEEVRPARDVV